MLVSTILPALALSLGGLFFAHQAWHSRVQVAAKLGGAFLLWLWSTLLWCRGFGIEVGIPLALESGALVAFAAILLRAERRPPKAAKERVTDAPDRAPGHRVRGVFRFLVAGPLGLAAAFALAVLIATEAPMNEQTRLVLAGLAIPTLWAILVICALMARRLAITGGIYVLIAAATYGLVAA